MSGRPALERSADVVPFPGEFAAGSRRGDVERMIRVGPVAVTFGGLDAESSEALRPLEAATCPDGGIAAGPAVPLRLEARRSDRDAFLSLARGDRSRLVTWSEDECWLMASDRSALLVHPGHEGGLVLLTRQSADDLARSLQNVLRVAVAWRLAAAGRGLLLHASAVVSGGRAVLFLGPSGAGKSTALALSAPRPALGDDVVVLEAADPGTPWSAHVHGLWADQGLRHRLPAPPSGSAPVGAMLRLVKAPEASIVPLGRAAATALVAAHAPFVSAGLPDLDVLPLATTLAASARPATLSFARSGGFWPMLDAHFEAAEPSAATSGRRSA